MLTVNFDLLDVRPGQIALDAGCGEGRHSFEFVKRGAKVFSLDRDMNSLRKTRYMLSQMKNKKMFHPEASSQVHSGDALILPFNDNTFDRIICSEVMEHVNNDDLACRELTRVLKKNGRIAITVPTFISESVFGALTYEYFTSPGGHIRKYIPKNLAEIMNRNGLNIYGIDFRHSFHTLYWLIRSVAGLHLDNHPFTRAYRNFLVRGNSSAFVQKAERFFDNFFPKSTILYGIKK
ncbi:MAG: methyltransferase domain-containing protein [Spirochaetes bacterium]|nr:methyltransferase domain-containing protein [Spirochaetota bacterium]